MKRIVSLLFVFILLCTMVVPVYAAEAPQPVMAAGFIKNIFNKIFDDGLNGLEHLDQALAKKEKELIIYKSDWLETGYAWEDVVEVLCHYLNETPEIIHLDIRKLKILSYSGEKGEHYVKVLLSYFEDFPPQLNGAATASAAKRILDKVPAGASDWEIVHFVHDELIRTITYEENIYDQTAYGALVEGKAVCNGYAMAFDYIMDLAGIPCETVVGYTDAFEAVLADSVFFVDESVRHAWNVVSLTGLDGVKREYYVDVTWDDLNRKDAKGQDYIIHDWLLIDQDTMNERGRVRIYHPDGLEQWDLSDGDLSYYQYTGYNMSSYDLNQLTAILKEQMQAGQNMLSVGMDSQKEYYAVSVPLQMGAELGKLANNLGLDGITYVFSNNDYDSIFSFHVYLDFPQS